MAFEYKINLNGEVLEATLGTTVIDKLEEPLDEGALNIPITVLKKQHKMLGLLEIEILEKGNVCNFVPKSTYETGTNETDVSQVCGVGATKTICIQDPLDPSIWSCEIQEAEITEETIDTRKFTYLIISDTVSAVSKDLLYKHDLWAIEYTHKLDKYLINTLTFTRPFPIKRRAPFEYINDPILDLNGFVQGFIPDVFINERYPSNQTITIPQCGFAKMGGGNNTTDYEKNVLIKSNQTGNTTLQNLTLGDATFNFTQSGVFEIHLGFDDEGTFIQLFKFFIEIFNERKYTLYDMLMRVRAVAPIETQNYFELTRIFNIDPELEEYFKKIEMPQMFIQKQTVRQVLNTMFKYINSISRLNHISFDDIDILTIDEFNKVVGEFSENEIIDFQSEQSAENYGSKAISWLTRSLQDNFRENPSIKTPAQGRFKTVRAKDIQLTGNSFKIKLEKPIYELSKIEVSVPKILVRSETTGGGPSFEVYFEDFVIDLTTRFIEKTSWDLKITTVNFPSYTVIKGFEEDIGLRLNKGGNLFWERNKSEIDLSLIIGEFFQEVLLQNSLIEGLNEYITLNPYEYTVVVDGTNDYILFRKQEVLLADPTDYKNLKFNIEYITFDDPTQQSDRADVSDLNYYGELRVNQQSRQTNFGLASRNTYGQLQRSGVPVNTFSKIHTTLSDLYDVGTIDNDGFIITQRSISLYPEHLEVTYQATKDHNRISEFIGISQEYRVFEIPRGNNIYDRRDIYSDYMMIIPPNSTTPNQQTMIFNVEKFLRRLYKRETGPTKVTFGIVRTDGMQEIYPDETLPTRYYGIMTPINSYGGKGGVQFNFGFSNNQIAGDALKKEDNNFYNEPIRYTDGQGFFNNIWFGFKDVYQQTLDFDDIFPPNEINANKEHKYPLIKSESLLFGQNFDIRCYSPLVVYKDASSTYSLTYQVNILPLDYNQYVLGQAFYTDNRSVVDAEFDVDGNDISPKMYLYKYKSSSEIDYTYRLFDDLLVNTSGVEGIDYDVVELIDGVNVSYIGISTKIEFSDNAEITNEHKGWAIGDLEGNLYIACNESLNGFKVLRRHFRPNIVEIGRLEAFLNRTSVVAFNHSSSINYEYTRTTNLVSEETISSEAQFDVEYFRSTNLEREVTISQPVILDVVGEASTDLFGESSFIEETSINYTYERTTNILEEAFFNVVTDIDVGYIKSTDFVREQGLDISSNISYSYRISTDVNDSIIINQSSSIGYGYTRTTNVLGEGSDSVSSSINFEYIKSTDFVSQIEFSVQSSIDYEKLKNVSTTSEISQTSNIDYEYIKSTDFVNAVEFSQSSSIETDYIKSTNLSGSAEISQGSTITYERAPDVEWVSGGTEPVGVSVCDDIGDVGNIRCDATSVCSWVVQSTYTSFTNETTNPTCGQDVERIVCVPDFESGLWACQVQVGDVEVTYSNCETCSIV